MLGLMLAVLLNAGSCYSAMDPGSIIRIVGEDSDIYLYQNWWSELGWTTFKTRPKAEVEKVWKYKVECPPPYNE